MLFQDYLQTVNFMYPTTYTCTVNAGVSRASGEVLLTFLKMKDTAGLYEQSQIHRSAEFQKVGILGSRIPDIILEKSGHFWLRTEI